MSATWHCCWSLQIETTQIASISWNRLANPWSHSISLSKPESFTPPSPPLDKEWSPRRTTWTAVAFGGWGSSRTCVMRSQASRQPLFNAKFGFYKVILFNYYSESSSTKILNRLGLYRPLLHKKCLKLVEVNSGYNKFPISTKIKRFFVWKCPTFPLEVWAFMCFLCFSHSLLTIGDNILW